MERLSPVDVFNIENNNKSEEDIMKKRVLSVAIVIVALIFTAFSHVLWASASIAADHANGVVTITGSGLTPDADYLLRVVNTTEQFVVTIENVRINPDGSLAVDVITGALTGENWVYINSNDGTADTRDNADS